MSYTNDPMQWTWVGKTHATDGCLQHTRYGICFALALDSFATAKTVVDAIEKAYETGKRVGLDIAVDAVQDARAKP